VKGRGFTCSNDETADDDAFCSGSLSGSGLLASDNFCTKLFHGSPQTTDLETKGPLSAPLSQLRNERISPLLSQPPHVLCIYAWSQDEALFDTLQISGLLSGFSTNGVYLSDTVLERSVEKTSQKVLEPSSSSLDQA
jgi:hypothetical protein